MINTKVYKAVYELAEKLMKAAAKEDRASFDALYAELEAICVNHENTAKDHPEQWETLADFTESTEDALSLYRKALDKAEAMSSSDHLASIGYSMALLQQQAGDLNAAMASLQQAQSVAHGIEDQALKDDIKALIDELTTQGEASFDQ